MEKRIYISNDIIQLTIKIFRTLQRDKENTIRLRGLVTKEVGNSIVQWDLFANLYNWFVVGKK
jgi:hypothetical protein